MILKALLKKVYNYIPFKKELFTCIKKIKTPPQFVYQHLHFRGVFKVIVNKNSNFLLNHYGYEVENEIFWNGLTGGWEKESLKLWIRLCEQSKYVMDIGANTGVYALIAKSVNSRAQVYGFEPVERVYKRFKQNCELNNFNVKTYQVGVSNYNGNATIYDLPTEHTYSVTVNKNLNASHLTVNTSVISVQKLSTLIEKEQIPYIDLMKIDVETHEPEVLEGMEGYLKKFCPTILIEILSDEIGSRVEKLLQGLDYLYFNIDEINPPQLVKHITVSKHFNYLICSRPVAKRLELVKD